MDLDSILKICKIVFMVLIPISLFILSSKYTRHIEDKKNQSSAVYDWNAQWADIFLKSYKNYQDLILELLHTVELLQLKVKSNTQNSDEGTEIQKRMNLAMLNIHKAALTLNFQISNITDDVEQIENSTTKIYEMVKTIFNSKHYNSHGIYEELKKLNKLVKSAHKKAVSEIA